MQAAHLQQSHHIQLPENKLLALKMAHQIEHQTPVSKTGRVVYAAESHAAVRVGIPHLNERLNGIENSCFVCSKDTYSLLVNRQGIGTFRPALPLPRPGLDLDRGHILVRQAEILALVQSYASGLFPLRH